MHCGLHSLSAPHLGPLSPPHRANSKASEASHILDIFELMAARSLTRPTLACQGRYRARDQRASAASTPVTMSFRAVTVQAPDENDTSATFQNWLSGGVASPAVRDCGPKVCMSEPPQ